MEGLIIFIIFIVFSLLKSLGGEGQRPPGRGPAGPRPVRPVRPVRPQRPVPVPRHPEAWPRGFEPIPYELLQEADDGDDLPEHKETLRPEPAAVPVNRGRHEQKAPAADAYALSVREEGHVLSLDADSIVLGVIFSEVLGSPRYKVPWRPH
ncbi:MAG: hypothetical protein SCK29_05060 [Bacillota bacterium]|nr:hypothetical protein [Bacillota bacterium]MDW7683475.1 hypothetical protein [Bacillota bacterium]